MSEMVERVAKAIWGEFLYDGQGEKPWWVERGNSLKQDEARKYARAAIKAMREPTMAMLTAAGYRVAEMPGRNLALVDWMQSHDWPLMIDAALAGGPTDNRKPKLCARCLGLKAIPKFTKLTFREVMGPNRPSSQNPYSMTECPDCKGTGRAETEKVSTHADDVFGKAYRPGSGNPPKKGRPY